LGLSRKARKEEGGIMFMGRLRGEWDDFVIRTATAKLEFKLAAANWSDLKSLLEETDLVLITFGSNGNLTYQMKMI
jgi:hypothetical protein